MFLKAQEIQGAAKAGSFMVCSPQAVGRSCVGTEGTGLSPEGPQLVLMAGAGPLQEQAARP